MLNILEKFVLLENNTKVFFHIYDCQNSQYIVNEMLYYFDESLKQKIEFCHNVDELDTLKTLYEFSKNNINFKILYIHTKGAVNRNTNVDSWRKYMCRYLISRYDECLFHLSNYDVCGVDFRDDPQPHFSGNFWWANSEYINKLEEPEKTFSSLSPRHRSEFWIGTKSPNQFSIMDCGVNVYERHLYNYDNF